MAEEALRGPRAPRGHDVQGQGRPRIRSWTSRRSRAIRDALPDADLYVDANRGWSYDDAVRAGDALVELGVRAIEEPISVEDRAGRLRLAERWAVPLGGDESCISLAHVDRALEEGAVRRRERQDGADRASPSRAGSSTSASPATSRSSWAASTRARSARLATIAFAAAFAATAGRPAEITNFLDLGDDLVVAGAARSATAARRSRPRPGLGFEVDEERLQRYRVDR